MWDAEGTEKLAPWSLRIPERHEPPPPAPSRRGAAEFPGAMISAFAALVRHRRWLRWAPARPVPRRRGRQHDALRADVRRIRARPGGRRHGATAGDPAVRVAARQPRRTAALSPRTADNVCGARRAGRRRDGPAALVRRRIGGLLLLGAALFLAQVARVLPGLDRAPAGWTRAIARLARRTSGGYPLGIVLGFLPCGFLYAALATSAASGNPAVPAP